MAIRQRVARKVSSNVRFVTTKTQFGVDSSMVVTDTDILDKLTAPQDHVFVQDDHGVFSVPATTVDSGLVCQLRTCEAHRAKWDAVVAEQGIELPPAGGPRK